MEQQNTQAAEPDRVIVAKFEQTEFRPGDLIPLKLAAEGSETLMQVATALSALASDILRLACAGWQLTCPVDGGLIVLMGPAGELTCWECGTLTLPGEACDCVQALLAELGGEA